MEVVLALPIIILPFLFPIISGLMAVSFRRRFWLWFCIGLVLPFISMIILLFLPDLGKKEIKKTKTHAVRVYISAKA